MNQQNNKRKTKNMGKLNHKDAALLAYRLPYNHLCIYLPKDMFLIQICWSSLIPHLYSFTSSYIHLQALVFINTYPYAGARSYRHLHTLVLAHTDSSIRWCSLIQTSPYAGARSYRHLHTLVLAHTDISVRWCS